MSNLYAWVSVVLVVLTLGLETGLFRFINGSETPNRVYATTLKVLATAVGLFYLISFCGLGSIAEWLGYMAHPEYVAIFILIVGLDAVLSIPFAYLRYQRCSARFAFYKFLFILLNIGFNLFFFLLCPYLLGQGSPCQGGFINLIWVLPISLSLISWLH